MVPDVSALTLDLFTWQPHEDARANKLYHGRFGLFTAHPA